MTEVGACRRPPTAAGATARLLAISCTAAVLLAACTSLSEMPPRGFDLSGVWVLDEDASDPEPDLEEIRRSEDRDILRGRQSDPTASGAFVAQDFPVLAAVRLEIEQDAGSMGMRYVRDTGDSTYTDFTWGRRERDFWMVHTGWHDGVLVILSERGRTEGRERMVLEDDGRRLRVSVKVDTGGEDISSERVFTRR